MCYLPIPHRQMSETLATGSTPKVILDEREAAQRKMKSHTSKSVDIMRQLKMRETDVRDKYELEDR